MAAPLIL